MRLKLISLVFLYFFLFFFCVPNECTKVLVDSKIVWHVHNSGNFHFVGENKECRDSFSCVITSCKLCLCHANWIVVIFSYILFFYFRCVSFFIPLFKCNEFEFGAFLLPGCTVNSCYCNPHVLGRGIVVWFNTSLTTLFLMNSKHSPKKKSKNKSEHINNYKKKVKSNNNLAFVSIIAERDNENKIEYKTLVKYHSIFKYMVNIEANKTIQTVKTDYNP